MSGLLLVAPSAVLLEARRKEFSRCMKEVLVPGQEQRATSQVGGTVEGAGEGAECAFMSCDRKLHL